MTAEAAALDWEPLERCVSAALGTRLRGVVRLGRPRPRRATWAAASEDGDELIVKARRGDFAEEQIPWTARHLPQLGARGYPVPEIVWQGSLDDEWYVLVQRKLPGRPLHALDESLLERVLGLVELQADADVNDAAARGHDFGEYQAHVLFDGWDDVWRDAAAASAPAAEFCGRLRRQLVPVWGCRVPSTDFAHNDLHLANILGDDGIVTGVIDWDAFAFNTRAVDLVPLAFDCARLGEAAMVETLIERVVRIAGSDGALCLVAYRAIAHLSALQRRHEGRGAADVIAAADTIIGLLR